MKFDKFIRRSYFLLEQDQNPQQTVQQPDMQQNQPPSAAEIQDPNQDPKKASTEVQNSEEGLLEVAKKLILCFKQISQSNDLKERDSFISDLMKASKGDAKIALQAIARVCDEYSQQAIPQQL